MAPKVKSDLVKRWRQEFLIFLPKSQPHEEMEYYQTTSGSDWRYGDKIGGNKKDDTRLFCEHIYQ